LALLTAALMLSACGGSGSSEVSLSGTATGVTSDGVILANVVNTVVMPITIPVNATTFAFPKRLQAGSTYSIYVQAEPVNLNCQVLTPAGVASNNVTTLQLVCTPRNVLGGTVSGLTGSGLALANGSDVVSVAANATTFSFTNRITLDAAYGVTILTQPAGQTCTVTNGSGKMGSVDITSVQVSCS
jgi:hypothetical protein